MRITAIDLLIIDKIITLKKASVIQIYELLKTNMKLEKRQLYKRLYKLEKYGIIRKDRKGFYKVVKIPKSLFFF